MRTMTKAPLETGGIAQERMVNPMKMLSPAEVADYLSISYDTALSIIKYSGIPYLKIGRQYRVNKEVLRNMVSQNDICIIDYDNMN